MNLILMMFVWRELPELRCYSDGLMCVIATSKEHAIELALDAYCGTHPSMAEKRKLLWTQLVALPPDVVHHGAVYKLGGE